MSMNLKAKLIEKVSNCYQRLKLFTNYCNYFLWQKSVSPSRCLISQTYKQPKKVQKLPTQKPYLDVFLIVLKNVRNSPIQIQQQPSPKYHITQFDSILIVNMIYLRRSTSIVSNLNNVRGKHYCFYSASHQKGHFIKTAWNERSYQFWKKQQDSCRGVMLGQQNLNQTDISFSSQVLEQILSQRLTKLDVLDCGAGIGRITKQLLIKYFTTIDLLQQCQHFVQRAKQELKQKSIRQFYVKRLQQFEFQHQYGCIWVQWVLTHLSDADAVYFLKNAKQNLLPQGFIVVKENFTLRSRTESEDSTILRTDFQWKRLFYESKLKIIKQKQQTNWPQYLQPVKIYLLQ